MVRRARRGNPATTKEGQVPVGIDVFLSVGRTSTPEQEAFVGAVERCLLEHGLEPHTLGRNDWSSAQPLQAIRELMERCSGAAVIAFERVRIGDGVDLAGRDDDRKINDTGLPTVWNQIEATMAHVLGLPLLVFAERGLRSEGLLESRYDWMVQWVDLDPATLRVNPCLGMVEDWSTRVQKIHESRAGSGPPDGLATQDIADKTLAELFGQLKPGQLRALIAGCIAVLGAAFTLGVTIGGG
jgi:hypothetical protein